MTTEALDPAGGGPSPEPLIMMMQGLQVTGILQAAVQLRVFDRIAGGASDATAIADEAGTSERGMRILLDGLAAIGLLDVDGERYRLTPLAGAFLVSDGPAYLGGMVDIFAAPTIWAGYAGLAEAVRTGGTVLAEHAETPEHSFWETFAPSSTGIAAPAAQALADLLAPALEDRDRVRVLDVACGGGLYGLTLARRLAQAEVTLLDWPNVVAIAKGTAAALGLADRVDAIEGDLFTVPLGGPYDVIVASHIFHHFSEERCRELLRRLAGALAPGGKLAINDFAAADTTPAEEPFPRLFSVLMLTWTREGEAYPVRTYERLLAEEGFGPADVYADPHRPSRFLVAVREDI